MKRIIWFCLLCLFICDASTATPNKPQNICLSIIKSHVIGNDTLWLDDCQLTDKDIPQVMAYLQQHPQIRQLYLLNNRIGDHGAILLSKAKHLELLEIRNNKIGKRGMLALANSPIQTLDLKGNNYKAKHAITLVERGHSVDFKKAQQLNNKVIILG